MRVVFGACTLDLDRRELRHQDRVQPLEPKAFTVLAYLLTHRDRAIAKEELLAACWPGEFVTEASLARCVRVIRQAVADDGGQQQVIKTLRGYGYRFVATVATLPAAAAALPRGQDRPSPLAGARMDEPWAVTATAGLPALGRAAPATTPRCPQCQTANRATRQFCAACGYALWQPCLHCGFGNDATEYFCGGCGRAAAAPVPVLLDVRPTPPRVYTPAYVASKILACQEGIIGERKVATVLVASLEGGQAGHAGGAPEGVDDVVTRGLALLVTEVHRVEGFVSQVARHGCTALFGAPLACEDHAVRALHAALGMQRALAAYAATLPQPHGMGLTLRLGVHTGPVVVSAISPDLQLAYTAPGATIAVATGLQQLRRDGAIVLSATVQQQATGFFRFTRIGTHRLPELADAVDVAICEGVAPVTSRLEGALARQHTAFQGRAQELALLQTCWARACQGTGQVVCLVGEAGIGKSRLAYECQQGFGAARWRTVQALSYGQAMPYHAVIPLLRTVLGVADTAPPTQQRQAIHMHLAAIDPALAADTPLLALLLGIPVPAEELPALAPEAQRQRLLHACCQVLQQQATDAPLCLLVEDGHWLDPSSQELLDLLVAALARRPILLLCTARPGFRHAWTDSTYFHQVAVAPLGATETAALLRDLVRPYAVAPALVAWIHTRTGGNPLFVEELVRTMQAQGLFVLRDNLYDVEDAGRSTLPASVQGMVQSRLDRLPAAEKSLLQLAAVIGPAVPVPVLQALVHGTPEELQRRLRALQAAEVLYETGARPSPTYTFKHALVQDAAYQSLLPQTRQQYHQQIAQVLEQQFPDTVATQPELLAQHYTAAGLPAHAIPYWQEAGQQARQRSANPEAVQHLTTGLALLATLPETLARAQQELDLQLALGSAFIAIKGYAAPEVEQTYARARTLCAQVGDTPRLFPTLQGLCQFYYGRGALPAARELGEQLYRLAQREAAPTHLLEAHDALGSTLFYLGDYAAAWTHLEQGIARTDPTAERALALHHGVAPGVRCLAIAANVLWCLGYPAQAMRRSQEALALAQALADPYSLALAQFWVVYLHWRHREAPTVQTQAEALLTLATVQGFPLWVGLGTCWRGWALAMQGQSEAGMAQLHQGMAAVLATEWTLGLPLWLVLLADAAGHAGQVAEGLRRLAEARTAFETSGRGDGLVEAYRLQGTLLLCQAVPDAAQAEACFQQALAIARRQQAKSWELQAAMSLSRLWQQQGKRAEARALLAPVYGWFSEGFDTVDLQEARALLADLC